MLLSKRGLPGQSVASYYSRATKTDSHVLWFLQKAFIKQRTVPQTREILIGTKPRKQTDLECASNRIAQCACKVRVLKQLRKDGFENGMRAVAGRIQSVHHTFLIMA